MLLDAEGDGEDDVAFLPGKWPLKFDKWKGGAAGTMLRFCQVEIIRKVFYKLKIDTYL